MTYNSDNADRSHFQSAESAKDGDLADTFAIDSSVNADDEAAPGLVTAPSPEWRGPRHAKRPKAAPDLTRLNAAADEPVPPRPPDRTAGAADDTTILPRIGPDTPMPPQPPPPFGQAAPPTGGPPTAAGPPAYGPASPGQGGPGDPTTPGASPDPGAGTDGAETSKRKTKRKGKRKAPWWELPLLVAVAILIAVLVKTFVIQPFYIPSESMEKTLHGCPGCKGDRILVNKPIYDLRDPHPGDIVVFHAPSGWDEEPRSVPPSNPVTRAIRGFGQLVGFVPPDGLVLVKRVIATGGQTVQGDAAGHVMISTHGPGGPYRTLTEPYVYDDGSDPHAAFGPVTVPKGRLWVMGDHRNDSADSRFHCGSDASQGADGATCDPTSSTVPVKEVIGKAVVIAWPPSRWRSLGTPSTFKSAAQALGGQVPIASGAAFVFPFYVVRRRRRRRT
jgi:signal peptidase I